VRAGVVPVALLGHDLDDDVLNELDRAGVDLAGEHGEYHTVVTAGPLFGRPLHLAVGEVSLRNGMWFLDVAVKTRPARAPDIRSLSERRARMAVDWAMMATCACREATDDEAPRVRGGVDGNRAGPAD
jgi:hypothetical protein